MTFAQTVQVLPTALSISVSFLSSLTLLGTPSAIYLFGTMYIYQGKTTNQLSVMITVDCMMLGISVIIASIVAAQLFMPKFREMNFTSTYEVAAAMTMLERERNVS